MVFPELSKSERSGGATVTPSPQTTPLREGAAQCSLFPVPCPCGFYPIEREEGLMNWCRCPELVTTPTVDEWNEWTLNQWERIPGGHEDGNK
jgi:hypothetical protein